MGKHEWDGRHYRRSLETKKYYYVLYCYRKWPSLDYFSKEVHRKYNKYTLVFEDIHDASIYGENRLFDDDTYGIVCIDNTKGKMEAYLVDEKQNRISLKDLRSFKIVKKEK